VTIEKALEKYPMAKCPTSNAVGVSVSQNADLK
jgi:hypothetical protein